MLPAVTQLKQGVNESRLTCNSLGKLNHSPTHCRGIRSHDTICRTSGVADSNLTPSS